MPEHAIGSAGESAQVRYLTEFAQRVVDAEARGDRAGAATAAGFLADHAREVARLLQRTEAPAPPPWTEPDAEKIVDLSGKLGPGWQLARHHHETYGDIWLLRHHGSTEGFVRRYINREGRETGWEARQRANPAAGAWFHVPATEAGARSARSSYLWRSRDLAAWGIAAQPDDDTPNPAWSRRPARKAP